MSVERKPVLRDGQPIGMPRYGENGDMKIEPALAEHVIRDGEYAFTHVSYGNRGTIPFHYVNLSLPGDFESLVLEHVKDKKKDYDEQRAKLDAEFEEELRSVGLGHLVEEEEVNSLGFVGRIRSGISQFMSRKI
jgi:hypothetical protein